MKLKTYNGAIVVSDSTYSKLQWFGIGCGITTKLIGLVALGVLFWGQPANAQQAEAINACRQMANLATQMHTVKQSGGTRAQARAFLEPVIPRSLPPKMQALMRQAVGIGFNASTGYAANDTAYATCCASLKRDFGHGC